MTSARILVLLACTALAGVGGRATAQQPARSAEASRIRSLYFARDWDAAYREGKALVRQHPADPELRGWWIVSEHAAGYLDQARRDADTLAATYPGSPWGHVARAYVLVRGGTGYEAPGAMAQARVLAPWDEDVLWFESDVWHRRRQTARVLALLDSAQSRLGQRPHLLVARGVALRAAPADSARAREAREAFATALRADSTDVTVLWYAVETAADSAARALAQRALALAPGAWQLHQRFWITSLMIPHLTAKPPEIVADIQSLLAARPDDPGALAAAAEMQRDMALRGPSPAADSLEAQLLSRFPDSPQAERLLMTRILVQERTVEKATGLPARATAERARLVSMLREFVARPISANEATTRQAHAMLFRLLRPDPSVSAAQLRPVVEGLVRYGGEARLLFAAAPSALADRGGELEYAEAVTRRGLASLGNTLASTPLPATGRNSFRDRLRIDIATCQDALGWVHLRQGHLGEAERELRAALDSVTAVRAEAGAAAAGDETVSASANYHLGRLAERRGLAAAAEHYYAVGYAAERLQEEHPNEVAFQALYRARHGSLEGWQQLRDSLLLPVSQLAVLRERIARPRPAPRFSLRLLDGGVLSSDSLRGRITLVNFWGTWCGPCVAELPQIQRLYEHYRGDPGVRILTIDNGDAPDSLRAFLRQRALTFPVLLDDRFANAAIGASGGVGYPTTWLLDREGRIAYLVGGGGSAEAIYDRHVWRIESLKATHAARTVPAR